MSTKNNDQEIISLKEKIRELLMKPENAHLLENTKKDSAEEDIRLWASGELDKPEQEQETTSKQVTADILKWAESEKITNRNLL